MVSASDQRAVLAGIENERLIPTHTIPLHSSSFEGDLAQLQEYLSSTKAVYILLKTHPGAADGYAVVTFVPNAAPVRQKMLFASTRLTLVRELGLERFREQVFATEKEELTQEGWRKHQAHVGLDAPLTQEETGLKGAKDAEAAQSIGTGIRRGHVTGSVDIKTGEGVLEALALLKEEGCKGTLVQLKYQMPGEILSLDSSIDSVQPEDVGTAISSTAPRYSFYSVPANVAEILFIYTCPSGSKIKERMIYATGKSWTKTVAERDAGITIARTLEATEPSELSPEQLGGGGGKDEGVQAGAEAKSTSGSGFSRPKRPGRRG